MPTLEHGIPRLEHVRRRIHDARVDRTELRERKELLAMLRALELKGSCLKNGRRAGAVVLVELVAVVPASETVRARSRLRARAPTTGHKALGLRLSMCSYNVLRDGGGYSQSNRVEALAGTLGVRAVGRRSDLVTESISAGV